MLMCAHSCQYLLDYFTFKIPSFFVKSFDEIPTRAAKRKARQKSFQYNEDSPPSSSTKLNTKTVC